MTKTITDGNGTTHFFDVFDGKRVLGTAMAFLPAGAGMPESVPMAVYYHGHNSQSSIEGYIKIRFSRVRRCCGWSPGAACCRSSGRWRPVSA